MKYILLGRIWRVEDITGSEGAAKFDRTLHVKQVGYINERWFSGFEDEEVSVSDKANNAKADRFIAHMEDWYHKVGCKDMKQGRGKECIVKNYSGYIVWQKDDDGLDVLNYNEEDAKGPFNIINVAAQVGTGLEVISQAADGVLRSMMNTVIDCLCLKLSQSTGVNAQTVHAAIAAAFPDEETVHEIEAHVTEIMDMYKTDMTTLKDERLELIGIQLKYEEVLSLIKKHVVLPTPDIEVMLVAAVEGVFYDFFFCANLRATCDKQILWPADLVCGINFTEVYRTLFRSQLEDNLKGINVLVVHKFLIIKQKRRRMASRTEVKPSSTKGANSVVEPRSAYEYFCADYRAKVNRDHPNAGGDEVENILHNM